MNKFLIIQFLCVFVILVSYGEGRKYVQSEMPENPSLYKIRSKNVTLRGPLPPSMNWVERGFNTPVRNQGNCGSCYAYSAVAAIEAQYFIKFGRYIKLSEQSVVDCSMYTGNNGCCGGWYAGVFQHAIEKGLPLGNKYLYYSNREECDKSVTHRQCSNRSGKLRAKIQKYYRVGFGNEEELKKVVATIGPVPIAVNANFSSFSNYKGDHVYYESACTSDNFTHAMLLVGYGTTLRGEDYWLIKNSWGTDWGDKGYMKLARNRNNHCGVASHPIYPVGVDITVI